MTKKLNSFVLILASNFIVSCNEREVDFKSQSKGQAKATSHEKSADGSLEEDKSKIEEQSPVEEETTSPGVETTETSSMPKLPTSTPATPNTTSTSTPPVAISPDPISFLIRCVPYVCKSENGTVLYEDTCGGGAYQALCPSTWRPDNTAYLKFYNVVSGCVPPYTTTDVSRYQARCTKY